MDKVLLNAIASQLRYYILEITHHASSGHPTTSFSAVELMTLLYFKYLRFDVDHPENKSNDRVIFSKGHASALFYSLYAVAGTVTEKELLTYRDFQSPLEGHPVARFPYTEAATGSLGQGLSVGVGEAWALRDTNARVYVLLGDGELAEGSNWEAVSWASHHKLHKLVAVADINKFGQSEETMIGHNMEVYRRRFEAFGWGVIVIDGHKWDEIDAAYQKALNYQAGPTIILAKTLKGKGVPSWEDQNGWHNKMLSDDELVKALTQYKPEKPVFASVAPPDVPVQAQPITKKVITSAIGTYVKPTPTKKAFGNALVRMGETNEQLVVLDGDMNNSTGTDAFAKKFPERFLQMYIAEQNMVGTAVGLARRGLVPVVSTFASFLTRAHDQIRMAPLSGVTLFINGSYAGVSMGKDGPSQMGLEDIALFRSILGSTVLSPSDPYQTERLVEAMLTQKGIVYMRTTREPVTAIYGAEDTFSVGGSHVFEPTIKSQKPVTILATGITVHEALKAKSELEKQEKSIRVIDCYSIKPLDEATIKTAIGDSSQVIIVEDHYAEGGLGEAVLSATGGNIPTPFHHLAVKKTPMSGTPQELLVHQGIDANGIMKVAQLI